MTDRRNAGFALLTALLVLVIVAWVYWPGQSGPALLDDRSSVLVMGDLKENPALAWDYVTGDRSGLLGRPVSMASFVLEKLYLDGGLVSSKQVNVCLHVFTGGLLIWLFWLLLRHIAVPGYRWLAVVLGAAWLLSPLYVSTVLYVVQRMAMLSTLFMLLACIAYVYWRERLARGRFSIPLLLLVPVSICLALLAKENAIVVIPILLLLEALWFQFEDQYGTKIHWLRVITLASIAIGGVGLVVVFVADYDDLAAAFRIRHFTLEERLLTQGRILWDYVGQLVVPDTLRMGLYHDDIEVSSSLGSPASTLQAIWAWAAVLLLAVVLLKWQWGRYVALAVSWFLIGHSVESTVLPLELYFEHRNYFPAIGLFLLPGLLFGLAVRHWPQTGPPLLVYMACAVIWLASLTSAQVQVWSSQPLLILSHLNAHPRSFRANADMAVQMANLGEVEAARDYSARAFALSTGERSGDRGLRDLALSCIANQSVAVADIDSLGTVDPERPFSSVVTLLTLVRMLQDDSCPRFDRLRFADRMAAIFLAGDSRATGAAQLFYSLAVLENTLQRWENADGYADRFLQLSPDDTRGLLMKLHFATALGTVDAADALRSLLLEMNDQGKLTVSEQQTLSLYLEN